MRTPGSSNYTHGTFFQALSLKGALIELRYAPEWWLQSRSSEMAPVLFDQDAEDGLDDSDDDDSDDDDSMAHVYYFNGDDMMDTEVLCEVDDEAVNPIWWATAGDYTGPVSLMEVLDGIPESLRGSVVAAHMAVLADIVSHEAAAAGMTDGTVENPRCVSCIAEPEIHAEVLYDGIVSRTRELVDALAGFDVTFVLLNPAP